MGTSELSVKGFCLKDQAEIFLDNEKLVITLTPSLPRIEWHYTVKSYHAKFGFGMSGSYSGTPDEIIKYLLEKIAEVELPIDLTGAIEAMHEALFLEGNHDGD